MKLEKTLGTNGAATVPARRTRGPRSVWVRLERARSINV